MSITPTFQGEVQFRRYSDTSTQGSQIVLGLADRQDLQSFVGLEGKRFMAVLVQIGDDEQPVPPTIQPRTDHSWSRQAGIWCQDKEFQQWVANCQGVDESLVNEGAARAFVLMKCGIQSRRELDTLESARRFWLADVAGPYRKWRIARGLE